MIYFYHVPKTGGTSLNMMFLSLGGHDGDAMYGKMGGDPPYHTLVLDGRTFVGWHPGLISKGNYFYAFSHLSYHSVRVPLGAFTFTCLRNPEHRVLSHYKELLAYRELNLAHPANRSEGRWLGDSFEEYLSNVPVTFLCGQVYMFSRKGHIDEAEAIIRGLSYYFFIEEFDSGIAELSRLLDLPLRVRHDRKARVEFMPSQKESKMLRDMLKPDWELYRRLHD